MVLMAMEAAKKLDELESIVGGLQGSGDDLLAVGRMIQELRAMLK